MIWLTEKQATMLHSDIIRATGGLDGLRDDGLLKSALNAPMQTYNSVELFPTIIEKTVRLACGFTQNHPFLDGNKRIGAHAMLVTLKLNGITLSYTQKELADVFLGLAAGTVVYDNLYDWVRAHLCFSK